MSSVLNCDGEEIHVSMSEEISEAITSWAIVAESYEQKTEMTLAVLGQYFLTRNQFIAFDAEIKFYISKGLNENDKGILEESALYLYEKNPSPEKKALSKSRAHIKKKITKIYNRLLQELFPSFLPPKPNVPPRVKIEVMNKDTGDDDTIPFPPTEGNEDDETIDEDETTIESLSINEPEEHIAPQFRRSRYGNATKALPQDLYESPENSLLLLDPILSTLKGKIIYEPCCGNGAIVKFLETRGFTVIARDLYTTEVKHDYLTEEDPEYDVMITNPRKIVLFYFI
jgi:hypothetical protein